MQITPEYFSVTLPRPASEPCFKQPQAFQIILTDSYSNYLVVLYQRLSLGTAQRLGKYRGKYNKEKY
jgi:hypothetical protein